MWGVVAAGEVIGAGVVLCSSVVVEGMEGGSLMCDSFVAMGSATADGPLVFGKNSDRPAAEEEQRPI